MVFLCGTHGVCRIILEGSQTVQEYLAHEKRTVPQDNRRTLGIVLLQVPRGVLFLMNEVALFTYWLRGGIRPRCGHHTGRETTGYEPFYRA